MVMSSLLAFAAITHSISSPCCSRTFHGLTVISVEFGPAQRALTVTRTVAREDHGVAASTMVDATSTPPTAVIHRAMFMMFSLVL
jgi:hypothetical protein